MADDNIVKCKRCGAKTSVKRKSHEDPREGHACKQCGKWVCGNCIDWTKTTETEYYCVECSGRSAPCGCA